MKDVSKKVLYKGREYSLVFNLNVMENIQAQYGTLQKWGELTDGKDTEGNDTEPDAKAIIFGFAEMINEGIDIDNEENGTDIKPMTLKQVGRMITDIGIEVATKQLNETVIESSKGEEKNA